MRPPGVIITGHMRSGTSMTAGIFAEHGVFFGDCHRRHEHKWLKRGLKGGKAPKGWPDSWWGRLIDDGWDGATPWGAKAMAVHWPELRQVEPKVVVCCYRPKEAILRSCEEFGGGARFGREYRDPVIDEHWEIMEGIRDHYPGTVVDVHTPDIVDGDYAALKPAFAALGMTMDEQVVSDYVDPSRWHHRV